MEFDWTDAEVWRRWRSKEETVCVVVVLGGPKNDQRRRGWKGKWCGWGTKIFHYEVRVVLRTQEAPASRGLAVASSGSAILLDRELLSVCDLWNPAHNLFGTRRMVSWMREAQQPMQRSTLVGAGMGL